MKLINLQLYTPEQGLDGVLYLMDINGLDWYSSQKLFEKQYKILVDTDGDVKAISEDVSGLWPVGMSVYEVDEAPVDIKTKNYKYIDNIFVDATNYEQKARQIRDNIRNGLNIFLLPASTFKDVLITDAQKEDLIKDSLALAAWPTTEGWPYIPLPDLSDTSKLLMEDIPTWEY